MRRPKLGDLTQPTGLDLVHKAADLILLRDEWACLDPRNRLPHILLEIVEGLRRPLRLDARLVLELPTKVVVSERQHAAVRVVDQHDLLGSEQPLRNGQRSDLVVSDYAAGVANDVRIALVQPE